TRGGQRRRARAAARAAGVARRRAWRVVRQRRGARAPRGGAVAAGARFHAARSRWAPPFTRRLSRQESLPRVVGVLVRLPARPARVAGALRGAAGQDLRG